MAQRKRSRRSSNSHETESKQATKRRLEPKRGILVSHVFPELDPFVFEYYSELRALKEMVEAEIDRPISRERAASCVHVSPASFSRFFRSRTGIRFRDWLEVVRIERAVVMLAKEDIPTNVLARQVGYRQPATFLRAFKRVIGATPQAWAREIRRTSSDS